MDVITYKEDAIEKNDNFFVKEDPARIYRDLRDILVEEFGIDRIEAGRNEFNVAKPKDKLRIHAFKEKSPHTVLYFKLSWKAKVPRFIYKMDRDDDILRADIGTTAKVITVYPGMNEISWLPEPITQYPQERLDKSGLTSQPSLFQRSKFYKVLTSIWYNKFYSKEIDRYEEEAKEIVIKLHDIMREKFGAEKSVTRTGASHYQPPWK